MKITSGPNWQWYAVTAFFVYASWENATPWPILGWLAFCVLLIPLCLWIHRLNERENEQMCKDFPHDPYIQAKYGKKKSEPKTKPKRPKEEKRWLSLPKLEGIEWIWADNWWDAVLSGVVEYEGKRYYAVCVDENYNKRFKWFRRYLMVDLPEDVWAEENERHAFFVEKVGSHFEYDREKKVRKRDGLKDSRTWHEFYERYPSPTQGGEVRDYKQYTHVGWFER